MVPMGGVAVDVGVARASCRWPWRRHGSARRYTFIKRVFISRTRVRWTRGTKYIFWRRCRSPSASAGFPLRPGICSIWGGWAPQRSSRAASTALATAAACEASPSWAASMAFKMAEAIFPSSYKTTRPSRLMMLLIMVFLRFRAHSHSLVCSLNIDAGYNYRTRYSIMSSRIHAKFPRHFWRICQLHLCGGIMFQGSCAQRPWNTEA